MVQRKRTPEPKTPESNTPEPEIQEGHTRGKARDDALKRVIKRHPQRDEPRVDSVEDMDLPPP